MKKLIAMLLTAVMVLGMTACGGNSTPATTAPAGEETTTETTADRPGRPDPCFLLCSFRYPGC